MPIFDNFERINSKPKKYHGESDYQYLNMVNSLLGDYIREAIEKWFCLYSETAGKVQSKELEKRLQSKNEHIAAFFELYLIT